MIIRIVRRMNNMNNKNRGNRGGNVKWQDNVMDARMRWGGR
jgi:hypothetical protein